MRSNYKPIGKYIKLVDERNENLKVQTLLGLSISKIFIPSVANIIGTDMANYKIIRKNQFACSTMQVRRDGKMPVALLKEYEEAIISPAYPVFDVINPEELLPEYLMMWMSRSEFDREACFYAIGGVRGSLEWEDFCDMQLPIPHPDKQRELVKEYNTIVNRINHNNQLIQKLEETVQALYKQWFVDFEFPDEYGQPYKSSGGEMEWCEELGKEVPVGWVLKSLKSICSKIGSGATPNGGKENYKNEGISIIRSMNIYDFLFNYKDLAFIDEIQAADLKNVIVEEFDILFNITGVSVARCCMVPKNVLPARVNQHVMIIRIPRKLQISNYILCHLCSSDAKNKLLGISQSGSTREAITKSEIEDYIILNPTKPVLEQFEQMCKRIITGLQNANNSNRHLNEFQSVILSKIVNA